MKSGIRSKLGALALIGIIVLSTAGSPLLMSAGPVQSAQAAETESSPELQCELNIYLWDGCSVNVDPVDEQDLDQLQAYQKGLSKIAAKKTTLQIIDNYAGDTEDIAVLIAEREIYKAISEDRSQAYAQSQAQVAIQEYYQTKKFNYLDFWNQYVTAAKNIDDTADAALYYPVSASDPPNSDSVNYPDDFDGFVGFDTQEVNFDKINKSITLKQPKIKWSYYSGSTYTHTAHWDPKNRKAGEDTWTIENFQFTIAPPSPDDGPQTRYLAATNWDGYQALNQKESEVINTTNRLVENTYSDFESGDLDAEEILSQVNKINNFNN